MLLLICYRSQVGKAADCKSVTVGSSPSDSSNIFPNGEMGITVDFDSTIPSSSLGSEANLESMSAATDTLP